MLINISISDKERIIDFINDNDLDFVIIDNNMTSFSIIAHNGIKFTFYNYDNQYVVVVYDKNKDLINNPSSMAYNYYHYNNLTKVMEQLPLYDNAILKRYWSISTNSIDVSFDKQNYICNWYEEFIEDQYWCIMECEELTYIIYDNSNYSPELISPLNTLHEVSTINKKEFTNINKLYFEIYPISCLNKQEKYYFKLLCNNEEILKEYINYDVSTKKGLKLLIIELFNMMEVYKK